MTMFTSSVLGLTGGIASGKSKVALFMGQKSGFLSLDADQIAKDLFTTQGSALDGLKKVTSGRFFTPSGQLNRREFRQAIFSDNELRGAVDQYAHPLIWQVIQQKVVSCCDSDCQQIVVEVPLLFEAGWQEYFQRIVVVYASYDISIVRLMARDEVSFAEATLAYNAQQSVAEKVFLADHVIDNTGSWCHTMLQVNQLCGLLAKKKLDMTIS